jgi:hypothetical protein
MNAFCVTNEMPSGLTAVVSIMGLVGTCENPRTKIILLRALQIALVGKAKKPSRPDADSLEFDIIFNYEESSGWT